MSLNIFYVRLIRKMKSGWLHHFWASQPCRVITGWGGELLFAVFLLKMEKVYPSCVANFVSYLIATRPIRNMPRPEPEVTLPITGRLYKVRAWNGHRGENCHFQPDHQCSRTTGQLLKTILILSAKNETSLFWNLPKIAKGILQGAGTTSNHTL